MKTKTELKHIAQDEILSQISHSLIAFQDSQTYIDSTPEEQQAIENEIKKQANRVAQLFGYDKAVMN